VLEVKEAMINFSQSITLLAFSDTFINVRRFIFCKGN